jgi:carbonic anhydrase
VSTTDDLLRNAAAYAETFEPSGLSAAPARRIAVVACMDARLDLFALLGLRPGDAHIIRNAGGVVTDDTIRSLAISQRMLGTEEVLLIQHTDCGLLRVTDEEFTRTLREHAGVTPTWAVGAFDDLDASVRDSIARITTSPFVPRRDAVRGFVFDVATGALREVTT